MTEPVAFFDHRGLITIAGVSGASLMLGGQASAASPFTLPSPVDTGHVENGKVQFPAWRNPADTRPRRRPRPCRRNSE